MVMVSATASFVMSGLVASQSKRCVEMRTGIVSGQSKFRMGVAEHGD